MIFFQIIIGFEFFFKFSQLQCEISLQKKMLRINFKTKYVGLGFRSIKEGVEN
jgi:hypothetical protein